ncbi:hydrogenase expression/formation protein [Legionella donaldsonii]|uniref:Hydrogenase expression/formation protein n=1 Tax=Legionella donaldsonii TaxID=45060 RepID=A0A378JA33_9GAMM|nr:hydrogenase maturation protease [Legionella donaldsonii]STX43998.1 hydrogenase expression/formation protein [Legionella donaldsonii]
MIELLILGIGSPFGDDRLGWEVVQGLQKKKALQGYSTQQLQFMACDRPGLNLLDWMQQAKTVFLIDAVRTGAKAGSLLYLENEEIKTINSIQSTHEFGLANTIEMGKILNLLPNKLVLYGIEINELKFQFEITEPIRAAIQALITRIEKDIAIYLRP